MTIFIEKGELIVGNQSPKFRCPQNVIIKKQKNLPNAKRINCVKKNYWPLLKYVRENKEQDMKFIL